VTAGLPTPTTTIQENLPWLFYTINTPDVSDSFGFPDEKLRTKTKGAFLRKPLTDAQVTTAYDNLNSTGYANPAVVFLMLSYGGQINAPAVTATATSHRDSSVLMAISNHWSEASEDAGHLAYLRTFYRDMFATTGGVPIPNDQTDGTYVNWPSCSAGRRSGATATGSTSSGSGSRPWTTPAGCSRSTWWTRTWRVGCWPGPSRSRNPTAGSGPPPTASCTSRPATRGPCRTC
jgi:hypothetical protein